MKGSKKSNVKKHRGNPHGNAPRTETNKTRNVSNDQLIEDDVKSKK